MRAIGGLVGLIITLAIGLFIYKSYFTSAGSAMPAAAPRQVIDTVGVKNDLISMGQAERIYQAEHSAYGSLDDLVSSGALAYKREGREGYRYDAESSADSFRITARCTDPPMNGCVNMAIDQNMEVTSTQ